MAVGLYDLDSTHSLSVLMEYKCPNERVFIHTHHTGKPLSGPFGHLDRDICQRSKKADVASEASAERDTCERA